MITRDEVIKLLHYNAATGAFTWKVRTNNRLKAGDDAGCVKVDGDGKSYRYITIDGRRYRAHRLAWLLLTGNFPKNEIDHINGDGLDNRAENLRDVTHAQNGKNCRKYASNTSGVMGVCWHKVHAKWNAYIRLNGKLKHLGLFDNFDEAVIVRKNAERKFGFFPAHGSTRPL